MEDYLKVFGCEGAGVVDRFCVGMQEGFEQRGLGKRREELGKSFLSDSVNTIGPGMRSLLVPGVPGVHSLTSPHALICGSGDARG